MSMRDALTSEALLALKAFGDLVMYIIEHRVDDYWDTDSELEDLAYNLLHNSIVFDDVDSSKRIGFFMEFPILLEVIKFCNERSIPLVVSLRFSYGIDSKKDNLEFLREYAEDKLTDYQKKTFFSRLEALHTDSERECFVSADKDAWLFSTLSMLASTAARNVQEERSSTDFIKLITEGNKEKPSSDSDFLLRLKSFLSLPAEKQAHDFPWKLQQAISSYLKALLNSEVHFLHPVLAWNKQLEWVRSILEQQSGGHNKFLIDPSCFAARTQSYEKAIPPDRRPVECLMLMEERGDIAFEGMEKTDDDDKGIVVHLTYLANDFLRQKANVTDKKSLSADPNVFHYGNSITDCEAHFIWKEGDRKNGQKFNNSSKRKYIWEYCRNICDKGFHSQSDLDMFVSEGCKRKEHVTIDDIKSLLPIIARYSDVPLKELGTYITFKERNGIEVKKVPL